MTDKQIRPPYEIALMHDHILRLEEELKAKEQECEELKERLNCNCFDPKNNNNRCISYNRIAEDYERDLKQLDQLKAQLLDQEAETLKAGGIIHMLEQTLAEIKAEMRKILMVGNGLDGKYHPVKNSSKQDCYRVLGKIQEILGTNQIKISEVED